MGHAKRELERWEDLKSEVTQIAIGAGALAYDETSEEYSCAEDPSAEQLTRDCATVLHRIGRLPGTLEEVYQAIDEVLEEAG